MLKRRGQGSSASRRRARGVYGPQSRAGGPRTRGRRVVPVRWSLRARAGRHDGRGASRRLTGSRVAAAPRPPTRPAPQCRAHGPMPAHMPAPGPVSWPSTVHRYYPAGTPPGTRAGARTSAQPRTGARALWRRAHEPHAARDGPVYDRMIYRMSMKLKNNLSIVSPRQLRARTFSV